MIFFIKNELHKVSIGRPLYSNYLPPNPALYQAAKDEAAKKSKAVTTTLKGKTLEQASGPQGHRFHAAVQAPTGVQASGSGNHAGPLGRQFQAATGSVHAPGNTVAGPSSTMPDSDPNRPNIVSDPVYIPPAKVVRHPGFGAGMKDPKEGP